MTTLELTDAIQRLDPSFKFVAQDDPYLNHQVPNFSHCAQAYSVEDMVNLLSEASS